MKEQRQGELLYLVHSCKEVDNARTAIHTIVNDYVPEVVTQRKPLSETGMNLTFAPSGRGTRLNHTGTTQEPLRLGLLWG